MKLISTWLLIATCTVRFSAAAHLPQHDREELLDFLNGALYSDEESDVTNMQLPDDESALHSCPSSHSSPSLIQEEQAILEVPMTKEEIYNALLKKYRDAHLGFQRDSKIHWSSVIIHNWPSEVIFYRRPCWKKQDCMLLSRALENIRFECKPLESDFLTRYTVARKKKLQQQLLKLSILLFGGRQINWAGIKSIFPEFHLTCKNFRELKLYEMKTVELAIAKLKDRLTYLQQHKQNSNILDGGNAVESSTLEKSVFSDEMDDGNDQNDQSDEIDENDENDESLYESNAPDNEDDDNENKRNGIDELRETIYNKLFSKFLHTIKDPEFSENGRISWSQCEVIGWPESVTFYDKRKWSREDCYALDAAMDRISFRKFNDHVPAIPLGYKKKLYEELREQSVRHFKSKNVRWKKMKWICPSLHLGQTKYKYWCASEAMLIEKIVQHLKQSTPGSLKPIMEKATLNRYSFLSSALASSGPASNHLEYDSIEVDTDDSNTLMELVNQDDDSSAGTTLKHTTSKEKATENTTQANLGSVAKSASILRLPAKRSRTLWGKYKHHPTPYPGSKMLMNVISHLLLLAASTGFLVPTPAGAAQIPSAFTPEEVNFLVNVLDAENSRESTCYSDSDSDSGDSDRELAEFLNECFETDEEADSTDPTFPKYSAPLPQLPSPRSSPSGHYDKEFIHHQLVLKFQKAHPSFATDPVIRWTYLKISGWPEDVIFYTKRCWRKKDVGIIAKALPQITFTYRKPLHPHSYSSRKRRFLQDRFQILHDHICKVTGILPCYAKINWDVVKAFVPDLHLSVSSFSAMSYEDFAVIERVNARLLSLFMSYLSFNVIKTLTDPYETEDEGEEHEAEKQSNDAPPSVVANTGSDLGVDALRDNTYNRLLDMYRSLDPFFRNDNRISWARIQVIGWPKEVALFTKGRWSRYDCQLIQDAINREELKFTLCASNNQRVVTSAYKKQIFEKLRMLTIQRFGNCKISWRSLKTLFPDLHLNHIRCKSWSLREVELIEIVIGKLESDVVAAHYLDDGYGGSNAQYAVPAEAVTENLNALAENGNEADFNLASHGANENNFQIETVVFPGKRSYLQRCHNDYRDYDEDNNNSNSIINNTLH